MRPLLTRVAVVAGTVGTLVAGLCTVGQASAAPPLAVSTVASGLDRPWDLAVAPDGVILTGERAGKFVAVMPSGQRKVLRADLSKLFAVKESGLMGLALDPNFAQTRRVYSCQAETTSADVVTVPGSVANLPLPWPNTGQVVNIVAWRVDNSWSTMVRERTVLTGIPVTASGRHAGCGLTAAPDGSLWIGTGDNAIPTNPQNPKSLGGKVLHIRADGKPAAGNPDPGSPVYTLGHRNVQGVALRPSTGGVYAIEQGTDADDELNLLRAGANYGYKPDRTPFIYDESVPMTDPVRVPGAVGPVWSSGYPTIATPALAFLPANGWGTLDGAVVISAQKGKHLLFVTLDEAGNEVVRTSKALQDTYGRLRGLAVDGDGSLLVSTDNGDDDRILRVRVAD
ncbi:PQQ-dependent sugar dehydrogenase [Gordonia sp. HNM0687]|uniref:PQQ-dependent sugar dehydrogenase n=1 Tax=Gordonia mangrovi TaxID=2665643 RepID=A0A6L7GPF3_9ACTN|nr:PQQ-dependent sugar dehydrogenase [Gordonia mangrovi]MXP21493.1 PQQ-dependent sugar dehydrogenase [Gordonia mangrovi]UVF80673.1 PQQ-dependent sugar dehydrogenase [Gordonia mangrovi]